jgi:hypothetical protein
VTVEAEGLDAFRERHRFDEWRDTPATGQALHIWRFFLGGRELPGRRALRIETVEAPGISPAIRSIWTADEEEAIDTPHFRVDLYEAPSRVEARELLLRLLAQFQSPLVERKSINAPGELAFGMPNDYSLVFTRGNMVVLALNAGRQVETVEPVARELDRLFTAAPDVARGPVSPDIRRAEVAPAGEPAPRPPVRLVLEAEDPLGRPVWFRLSAEEGDFYARDDSVFYTPETEGRQRIDVAAVNENLGSAVRQLEFEI